MPLPHLLLVGAGHAHLYLLRQNALLKRFRITLVDPGGFWYSGLASGVLAGDHRPSEDRIDPALLCRQNGVDFIRARLVALDHEQQRGMMSNGSWLSFDYLSLNLGSAPLAPLPVHSTTKGSPHYWPVKPIPRLLQCRRSLERRFHHLPLSLHVLGAGASGIEVACATRALARRHGVADMALPIHLHHRGNGPLAQASAGAQRYVRDCLDRRAITLRVHPLAETTSLPPLVDDEASDIIDARGLAPPQNLAHLGLPTLAGRGIAVAADLRIDGSTTQFAAGDCAAIIDQPLPRLGVHGVRQGPILAHNLLASLAEEPLKRYHPPKRALSIINLCHGEALALYGSYWWGGRLASRWKRHLDMGFMRRTRVPA